VQTEIDQEQKFHFQGIHFRARDPAYLCVERVLKVMVVEKFCGQHHAGDDDSVYVQGVYDKILSLNDTVDVNKRKHEALAAA